MKDEVDLKSGDLHANPSGFDAMGEGVGLGLDKPKGLWLEDEQEDLLGVTDSSIFYNDFPSLLDFTCMSSSSSSSTPVEAVKPATSSSSSSSSASSWAILKSDAEEDVDKKRMHDPHYHQNDPFDAPPETLSSTASMEIPQPTDNGCGDGGFLNCMDVMENLGYMDILESNDYFDPSSIFENNTINSLDNEFPLHQEQVQPPPEESLPAAFQGGGKEREDQVQEDDMAMVFLEWLKSNRETVSADDLRNVKIKKSTIERAAKRLGGGKEAMKQLLKLVLEWVQKNHLQKRKNNSKETTTPNNPNFPNQFQGQDPFPNQNPPNPNPNTVNSTPPQPPYMTDPDMAAASPPPFPQSIVGYTGDPYSNGGTHSVLYHPPPPDNYHMVESTQSWPPSQFAVASQYNPSFPDNNIPPPLPPLPAYNGFGNQYPNPYSPDDRLMRLDSSATKEARKKRMARQRRYSSRHRHHHQNHGQQNQVGGDPHAMFGNDNYTTAGVVYPGNWVYWPPSIQGGMGSELTGSSHGRNSDSSGHGSDRYANPELSGSSLISR
ncbi:B3 domain-containing transcription factor ABI3-like [Quillaja saponaria]|uniref:B3 domain-containing transcription factor ABI3-like n=1 Tax=Quillaja saponaria TaxID=32244 RepID=A0AAD7PD26_QUISA|nr:B3 domain-containing transcription factor ABI3-like [Quillaja saponaria]